MNIGTCNYCGDQTVDGRCVTEMRLAFDKVHPADDWKGPIAARVSIAALYATLDAIRFYTATEPTYEPIKGQDGKVRAYWVESIGYRAGPAGP